MESLRLVKRNPDVLVRQDEDGFYLAFNVDTRLPLIMNRTSLSIWNLCDGTNDATAIANKLLQQYDFSQSDISADRLVATVGQMIDTMGHAALLIKE